MRCCGVLESQGSNSGSATLGYVAQGQWSNLSGPQLPSCEMRFQQFLPRRVAVSREGVNTGKLSTVLGREQTLRKWGC